MIHSFFTLFTEGWTQDKALNGGRGPHSSPGLSDAGNVCPQGMGSGQGAEKVQIRGVEEAHGAISTATEDVVLAHRDAVGHGGLHVEGLRSVQATYPTPPQ